MFAQDGNLEKALLDSIRESIAERIAALCET